MPNQPAGHPVDTNARKSSIGTLFSGVVFTVAGAGLTVATLVPHIVVAPSSGVGPAVTFLGVVLIFLGIGLRRTPTSDARIILDEKQVTVRLRHQEIRIPWDDVDHWGLAKRPVLETKRLMLWPVASPDPATVQNARLLWDDHRDGWGLCRSAPGEELIEDFTYNAPRKRIDHRTNKQSSA